ncbi:hypothetical protein [Methylobacterium komagatae]
MPTLHVVRPFNLILNEEERKAANASSTMLRYEAGRHDDVPSVIADHPYVRMHLGDESAAAAASKPVSGNALAVDLDAAVRRAEAAEKALQAEREAHAATKAKYAETAEKMVEAHEITTPDEDVIQELTVRHKGRGLFAVFRGDEQLTEPMPKAEAEERKALEQQGR